MLQPFLAQMGLTGMNTVSNQFNGQTPMPQYSPVLRSAQPEYQASSRADHSSHNLTPSAPTSNTVMSSGGPLMYHNGLLKSYTGGTIRQGDDRFFL